MSLTGKVAERTFDASPQRHVPIHEIQNSRWIHYAFLLHPEYPGNILYRFTADGNYYYSIIPWLSPRQIAFDINSSGNFYAVNSPWNIQVQKRVQYLAASIDIPEEELILTFLVLFNRVSDFLYFANYQSVPLILKKSHLDWQTVEVFLHTIPHAALSYSSLLVMMIICSCARTAAVCILRLR